MDLKSEMKESSIILLIISKDKYHGELIEAIKAIDSYSSKICYVCINSPYSFVVDNIQKNSLKPEKFFFIDTLTKSVQAPPNVNDCIFVSAPNALTEISLALTKALNEKHCDSTLFDTISTLLVYENQHSLIQFVHNVLTKLRISKGKAVFVALKDDINSELVKDLYMFVDKVIDLDK